MRYGCCSHLLRGRGRHGHGPTGDAAPAGEVKDPVCGMGVDPKNAAAAAVRGGTTHYFCSVSCRDRFEQPAEQIANGSGQSGHQHG
ncbi:MAG: YHS domain-containing protein [Betaproteobacteria bacterium]|nr:YHS domain-containing protein [Betaproteobacteria bacterium]MBI2959738.1 YHS domain-containing protein [Betaproteobacteria bacterium]